jgi:hypothetical protein
MRDLEATREQDADGPTALVEDPNTCPWCGAASRDRICDSCGRRRNRYATPAAAPGTRRRANAGDGERVVCPACFGRIEWAPRCPECGVPLPARE